MARPINPQAARRQSEGGPVEILAKSGIWVKYEHLSYQSLMNVSRVWREFPEGEFYLERDGAQRNKPEVPENREVPEGESRGESRDDDEFPVETESESQGEGESESESESQGEGKPEGEGEGEQGEDEIDPLTEMVKRIARREATILDEALSSTLAEVVDERLKNYEPKGEGGGEWRPITVEVTVRRPDGEEYKSGGLFHQEFPMLLELVGIGQHTYLPGPPGSGKSHAGKQVADAIGYEFTDISLSNDMPETKLWGGRTPNGWLYTPIVDAIRHASNNPDSGAVVLLDEMDAARPGLMTSLNSTLANGRLTLADGEVCEFGPNLVFIGAANTYGTGPTAEFTGRNKLDAATLDRFAYLPWDTDEGMEQAVISTFLPGQEGQAWGDAWRTLRENVKQYGLKFHVTMRGARNGARMIAGGIAIDKAMTLLAANKIPADQWSKVNPL